MNHYVVTGKTSMNVVFSDGKEAPGKAVYTHEGLDLSLVKVEGSEITHLSLADISRIQKGQTVIAIGDAGGGSANTVTRGNVSAIGRDRSAGSGT